MFKWHRMENGMINLGCYNKQLSLVNCSHCSQPSFPPTTSPPPYTHTHRCPVCHCWLCEGPVFPGGQQLLQHSLPSHSALHEGFLLSLFRLHPTASHWNYWVSLNRTFLAMILCVLVKMVNTCLFLLDTCTVLSRGETAEDLQHFELFTERVHHAGHAGHEPAGDWLLISSR